MGEEVNGSESGGIWCHTALAPELSLPILLEQTEVSELELSLRGSHMSSCTSPPERLDAH